jgi:DNA repair protein RadC
LFLSKESNMAPTEDRVNELALIHSGEAALTTAVERCAPHLTLVDPAAPAARRAPQGKGHRERLRRRLFEGGPDALLDHETVEYLLGLFIQRRDTKPLAKRLISEFGGFGRLFSADPVTLKRVGEISESAVAAIKIVQAASLRLLERKISERPVLSSWQALMDYLRADMAHEPIERVRILFLNTRNMLIANEKMWDGSVDESAVHIREIMKRALQLEATAIIIVHNHPSGDPSPSQQDIRLTRDLVEAGRHLKVTVHDHVIIGVNGHSSLRAMGLL